MATMAFWQSGMTTVLATKPEAIGWFGPGRSETSFFAVLCLAASHLAKSPLAAEVWKGSRRARSFKSPGNQISCSA